ncbi:MAG: hypothetical protein ACQKBY_06065 [Verrucomicrobiales bacterium]
MNTYNDTPYQTFLEATPGALDDKAGFSVALDTAENSVKLATGADDSIGIMKQKLQPGTISDGAVNVRLLGKGGTVKAVAGGVIAKGARVKSASGGKVVAASAGDRSIGIKLTQGSSADGDVIEILDIVEFIPSV